MMLRQTRTYRGTRMPDGCRVTVNGVTLPPRTDLRNHSPDGFEWGYFGSGPSQLALAILADHFRYALGSDDADELALRYYQRFKEQVISRLAACQWEFTTTYVEGSALGRQHDLL